MPPADVSGLEPGHLEVLGGLELPREEVVLALVVVVDYAWKKYFLLMQHTIVLLKTIGNFDMI